MDAQQCSLADTRFVLFRFLLFFFKLPIFRRVCVRLFGSSCPPHNKSRSCCSMANETACLDVHIESLSQDTVRDVLVAIVQLGRERVERVLDQLLHLSL